MKAVLTKSHGANMTSIAVPAIGTGNLGIPPNMVACWMFGEVEDFSRSHARTSLRDIRFVVYHGDKPTCDVSEFRYEC
jgi:poly [ADP-ribose] polymerase 10/14/15